MVSVEAEVARSGLSAGGGGPVPRLRHSGEWEAAWLGLGAPLGRGETVPEVYWSWGRPEVGAQRGGRGRRQPWQPAAVLGGPAQQETAWEL